VRARGRLDSAGSGLPRVIDDDHAPTIAIGIIRALVVLVRGFAWLREGQLDDWAITVGALSLTPLDLLDDEGVQHGSLGPSTC
jgi:hypothetical protein